MATSPVRAADPPAPRPPETGGPGATVRWLFDILNTHHAPTLRAVLSDTTRERFPTETRHGADRIVDWFEGLFAALPDLTMTIQGMAEQGETVFVRWRLTGTHTGAEFEGIAPTGKRIDLDGVDHFVLSDGVVVSNFVIFDQMQFARQLGLLPTAGSRVDIALRRGFNALLRARG